MKRLSVVGWGLFWFLSYLGGILAFRFVPHGFVEGFLPGLDQGLGQALYDGVYVGIRDNFRHIFYHVADRLTPLMFHMMFGALPIFFVPFQLWRGFRVRHPVTHRWMGRLAVAGILASAWGAVNIAVAMPIPAWGRAGFVTGAGVWVGSALWATSLAMRGKFRPHERWMQVTAAMTFGAVMIRIEFPMWRQVLPFDLAYACAAWSAWTLNLAALALWRAAHPRRRPAPRAAVRA